MIGLIKKDFLIIKSNLKLIIAILFVFFIMAMQGQFDISFIPPFIVVMLFMSTFSYDEYNKWDSYVVTLPNGRKNVVKSKYIASLILIVFAIIVTILLEFLVGLTGSSLDFDKFISTLMGSTFAIVLFASIMYPLIFKYGIEKGRIGLFVLVIGIVGIIGIFQKVFKVDVSLSIISFFNSYWFVTLPLVLITILFISYKISEKIYLKKEF